MTPQWGLLHISWRNSLPGQTNHFCIKMTEAWKGKKIGIIPLAVSLKELLMGTNTRIQVNYWPAKTEIEG